MKDARHLKTHNEEENQPIKTDPVLTPILELTNIKKSIIPVQDV